MSLQTNASDNVDVTASPFFTDSIRRAATPVVHRDEEYDEDGFELLQEMQSRHFWYRGRFRFLLKAVQRHLVGGPSDSQVRAVDLGGGCGGWIQYLQDSPLPNFAELALADSSEVALELAAREMDEGVTRYHVDLLELPWHDRWDAAFLLDVLEHIPDDVGVLSNIRRSLRPGGLLFVTTPALQCFWSYNDDLAHHVRRYSRKDYRALAERSGFALLDARYFMFLLSPLLVGSRLFAPDITRMNRQQIQQLLRKTHGVPSPLVNRALQAIFSLETPLGHLLPFPWGTSILGVFQKPS